MLEQLCSNRTDVVAHHGAASSPPNDDDFEQFYVHEHLVDHNLVLEGHRIFTLLNPLWDKPHQVVYLERAMGALQIPIGTFHRSVSGEAGSMVLNQSIRDRDFNSQTEFNPVSLRDRTGLPEAHACDPWIWSWSWRNGHICRQTTRCLVTVLSDGA